MPQATELPDPAPKYLWLAGLFVAGLCTIPVYQCKRALDNLGDWPTQNVIVKETPSPDGKLRLVEYIRRAGVSSSDGREFSILGARQPLPDENGNAFRLNAEVPGVYGFPESRKSPVHAKWIGNGQIEITYPRSIEVIGEPTPVTVLFDGVERRVDVSARPVKR